MTCERPCEAPVHHKNCPCVGCDKPKWCRATNQDHFTPKCVAKKMGWKPKQMNRPENLQWLSNPCHRRKDRSTPARKNVVKKGFITLDRLRVWRNEHDLIDNVSSSE